MVSTAFNFVLHWLYILSDKIVTIYFCQGQIHNFNMHASNMWSFNQALYCMNITEVFNLNLSSQNGGHAPMPNIIINIYHLAYRVVHLWYYTMLHF